MKFRVEWITAAEDDLTLWWLDADDRHAINHAAQRAEQILRSDPFARSQEMPEGLRSLDVGPLRFIFEVHLAEGWVEVQSVSRFLEMP